jgi:flagellar basal-body rod modification protein FlgD
MASTDLVGNVKDLIGQANKSTERKVNKELGKDAFLQLLVSQLKHQDPMKPMDDTSFIAEMAQFSSLEQMQNMNKLLEAQQSFGALSQASNMIGKYVTIQLPGEEAQIVKGKVEEVRSMAGQINVVIDGKPYNSVDIRQVSDQPTK